MLLRFSSDRRTLVWALVLFPLAPALAYLEPRVLWFVTPFAFYLSYCAGVLPWFNWLTFDNGYHTVHHEQPGQHWSLARAEHHARARGIAPHLEERSPFSYCVSEYVLKHLRVTDSDANSRGRLARKLIEFWSSQVSEVAHVRPRRGVDHR